MSFERLSIGQLIEINEIHIHNNRRAPLSRMQRDQMKYGKCFPYYGAASQIDEVNEWKFNGDFLLVAEDGTVFGSGSSPKTQRVKGKFWVSNHAHILSADNKESLDFLEYSLIESDISSLITGAVQPKLSKSNLLKHQITWPSRPLRIAIAEVLSSLDDKIDLLKRQNKTLEGMAEALFRQWFIEEAQDDWETVPLSNFIELRKENLDKSWRFEYIKYLDTGSITEGVIESFIPLHIQDAPSRAKRIAKSRDLVFSLVRPNHKHFGILPEWVPENLIVSTGFAVLKTKEGLDAIPFCSESLRFAPNLELLHSIAEGSTSTYPSLKPIDILEFEVTLPKGESSRKLIFGFSNEFWPLRSKVDHNQRTIASLEAQRNTLLPKLMSGEVRVNLD